MRSSGVEGTCADASPACGISSCVAQGDALPRSRRSRFSERSPKGTEAARSDMLVADHLRVAASKAGVVAPPRTFGFHTLRRTLASVLVNMKVHIKTVQEILRHQNLKTTLEIYAKAMSEDKLEAQGMFLEKLFSQDHKKKSPQDRSDSVRASPPLHSFRPLTGGLAKPSLEAEVYE